MELLFAGFALALGR